jgi:hypothetical protein
MSNITNTCLYQACTKITNIPSQDMCLNQVPTCTMHHASTCAIPVPSTMYHNMCINHASTIYQSCIIPCATMHINHAYQHVHQHHTMYQSCTIPSINHVPQQCTSTMCIQPCTNTCTKPCASTMHLNLYHMPQPSTMYHVPSTNMYHTMYQPCTSINHVHQHPYHVHIPYTIYHEMCLNHIPYHSQSCHVP